MDHFLKILNAYVLIHFLASCLLFSFFFRIRARSLLLPFGLFLALNQLLALEVLELLQLLQLLESDGLFVFIQDILNINYLLIKTIDGVYLLLVWNWVVLVLLLLLIFFRGRRCGSS